MQKLLKHQLVCVPTYEQLNWTGFDFTKEQFETVTAQDKEQWIKELESHTELFNKLGDRLPAALKARQAAYLKRLNLRNSTLIAKKRSLRSRPFLLP